MATQEQTIQLLAVLDKLAAFKATDLVLSSEKGFPAQIVAQSDLMAVLSPVRIFRYLRAVTVRPRPRLLISTRIKAL